MQILAKYFALLTTVTALLATAHAAEHETTERVYADEHGVIRWTADDREVALFGANYSLSIALELLGDI